MSTRHADSDVLWGKTRSEYAFEHVRRRREAERRRRQSFRAAMLARPAAHIAILVPLRRATDDEWHLRIRRGRDMRDLTGRLMGDPVTGRSALDMRAAR
ncbi:hypothetical protein [Mesorhizobium huakuii]|uniref:Uncharacterized protein n=1 Tax=Mesorhizobium huakuii TaxID=28104 RepID=A0A7G6T0T5_9HYPH|nr:hypothetical protein [Mesorhizobium huakuii]QND60367.1 hypothetical protein HB778_30340 [Mesorhizobium huakuii]